MVEFRDAAWDMFQAIQNATETEFGNARINDVTVPGSQKIDSMEVSCSVHSFFLGSALTTSSRASGYQKLLNIFI